LDNNKKVIGVLTNSANLLYMSEQSIYLASTKNSDYSITQTTVIHKILVSEASIIPCADG
jgi:hypothetical protein